MAKLTSANNKQFSTKEINQYIEKNKILELPRVGFFLTLFKFYNLDFFNFIF